MTAESLHAVTLGQILDRTVAAFPDNEAVVYVDRDFRLTYREFGDLVDRLARGLMAMGIQKGEKVAVWATNVPYWVALQFATAKIGAVLLTINTNYRISELAYVLAQSETENLFLIDGYQDIDYLQTVYELVPELRTQERGHLTTAQFPHLKRVFFLGLEKHRGMYSVPEVLAMSAMTDASDYRARQAALDPHDVVNMQYTSGTTGFPKGVMLTHHNIGNNGFWIGANQHFGPADRVCLPVPLFHCFGCVLGVLAAVNHGATLVILEGFDPVAAMTAVEQERCTALYGVPTMFIAILDHKLFDKFRFDSLRTGIMAGSPCPVAVMRQVIEKMYMREITICYGLTETSPVITQTLIGDDIQRQTATVGRAMPGIEVKVVDPKTGDARPAGVQGEVCCRGYSVMKGYYKHAGGDRQGDRRRRLAALRRPRRAGRRRVSLHHRAAQGHDHPRRREHLPARDRGVPLQAGGRRGRPGGRRAQPQVRRGGGRLHQAQAGGERHGGRCQGFLPRPHQPLQDPTTRRFRRRLSHDGQRQDPEIQAGRAFQKAVPGGGSVMIYNEEFETMPREALESIQLRRLQATVARVYNATPFYRRRFDEAGVAPADIRSLSDLQKLPFTTKADLRDNYPFGMFAVPMDNVTRIHASSGTTGKPTVVGYTARDIQTWAELMARSLMAAGARRDDIVHNAYGYGLFTGGLGVHYGAERLGASVIPISGGNTKRQMMIMKDFGPTVLTCTPSYALHLAEVAAEMGVSFRDLKFKAGIFGAEPWSEQMRREIERTLNLKAMDIYGLSEVMGPGVAIECIEAQNGLHVFEDHFIPEIINPQTGAVLPYGTPASSCSPPSPRRPSR